MIRPIQVKSTIAIHILSDFGDEEGIANVVESLREAMKDQPVVLEGITLTER